MRLPLTSMKKTDTIEWFLIASLVVWMVIAIFPGIIVTHPIFSFR